jgi:hypothetical protein
MPTAQNSHGPTRPALPRPSLPRPAHTVCGMPHHNVRHSAPEVRHLAHQPRIVAEVHHCQLAAAAQPCWDRAADVVPAQIQVCQEACQADCVGQIASNAATTKKSTGTRCGRAGHLKSCQQRDDGAGAQR